MNFEIINTEILELTREALLMKFEHIIETGSILYLYRKKLESEKFYLRTSYYIYFFTHLILK